MKKFIILVLIIISSIVLISCTRNGTENPDEYKNLSDDPTYFEENGWYGIYDDDLGGYTLMGYNGNALASEKEYVYPTVVAGKNIDAIFTNGGMSTIGTGIDKVFIKNKNYKFFLLDIFNDSLKSKSHYPDANETIVFLSTNPLNYKKGFVHDKESILFMPYYSALAEVINTQIKYAVPQDYLNEYKNLFSKEKIDSTIDMPFVGGNISYFYNYNNSPNNGYAWIDYLDEGGKILTVPEIPTRIGYTFDGWYTEKETINKFDFDTYLKTENAIKLYAKWIQIKGE